MYYSTRISNKHDMIPVVFKDKIRERGRSRSRAQSEQCLNLDSFASGDMIARQKEYKRKHLYSRKGYALQLLNI